MKLVLRSTALSDVGRVRRDNQDSGYAGRHLLVIADGVGGAARGDVASSATVDALDKLDVPPGNDALSELAATIHLAHDRLAEIVEQHPELEGTSTTVTAALFDGTHLRVAHVGDSRGYLLRDGELTALTTDHTLVQSLVDEGRITEAEARVHPHRNLILRAVDGVHEPEPDLFSVDLRAGDRLLLCSDGCSGVLENAVMAELMTGPLADATQRLVRAALDAGSSDNVTVVLAEILDADDRPAAQQDPGTDAETDVEAGAHAGSDTGPGAEPGLVVGAAATSPHLRMNEATGNLSDRDLAVLGAAEADFDDYDPEEIRYAPRPPRRGAWFRRLILLAIVLAALGYGAKWLYDTAQNQYYVDVKGDEVVIYRGIDLPLLNSVYQHTGMHTSPLLPNKLAIRTGSPTASLASAQAYVERLRDTCERQIPPAPVLPDKPPFWPPWLQNDLAHLRLVAQKCGPE